ncbi:Ldh family oxidoreductase [Frankia nepalensis]|uniref:Ldh family oxidoreductase n=1 Tax=Frankia nepalensis TaxID=1836974 RepID=A0A937UQ34_9ACTN|nr:Ldh family oxidoreductase [Frankia nepalensis]MBL7500506.1 Ldh family oxidoreductase [Frankia nepalensis]MBL7511215.1 Ldh family oxidoreductase [Frankia nepalensis]MBL7631469.1 Ldh family oxidoreductase [Frankia nepalensis]
MDTDTGALVAAADLRAALAGILTGWKVPAEQAGAVAELLVEADLRGVDSHGAHLMSMYVSRLASGDLSPTTTVSTVHDDGTTAVLDGGLGFGQLAGLAAARLAAERAERHGVAAIAVRETTHLGALGAYTARVAEAGHICLCVQNGPTFVPPFGGVTALMSTNPLSYAVPTGREPTIVYDIATTAVAGNKLLLAKKRGDPTIPAGWANDAHGHPTTDTAAASVRHLQWFGGHKGFGLALLVELLAGVLAGSSFGTTERTASALHGDARIAKGVVLVAISPERFTPRDTFTAAVDTLIREIRGGERAAGVDRIWLPGEPEHERAKVRARDGIPLPAALVAELRRLAADVGAAPLRVRPAGQEES